MNTATLISSAMEEVLTPSVKLGPILLKIKAIAHFIKNKELKEWAELELNGYGDSKATVPEYRRIRVSPTVNLIHEYYSMNQGFQRNMPMITDWLDDDLQKTLTTNLVANGIVSIEQMSISENDSEIPLPYTMTNYVTNKVYKSSGWIIHRGWLRISNAQLHELLSTIRANLLDLLLKLDALGPDALIPSLLAQPDVKEKIAQAVQSITAPNGVVNFNYGDNGQHTMSTGNAAQLVIAQGNEATQTIHNGQPVDLAQLVAQLKEAFSTDPAFTEQQEEINSELERIEAQLPKSQPNKNILTRSVETLQQIAKGGAAGAAVVELLTKAYEHIQAYPL